MYDLSNEKILLTGSNGFIGRHFQEYFNNNVQNGELYCLKSRLEDVDGIKNELDLYKPTSIIHLGGIPVIKPDENNPSKIITTNILGTFNILNNISKFCNFILASTVTVYGDKDVGTPSFNEQNLLKPTSMYAATKIMCENMVNIYTKQGVILGSSLRLCAVVGKYSTHGIIHDFIKKLESDSEYLEVLGNEPGSSKPFLHANDVCDAFIKTIINPPTYYKIFNICNYDRLNVKNIAETVMDAMNIHKPIKWLGEQANWKGDNKLIDADSKLAANLLKWNPTKNSATSIYQAVKDITNESY